MVKYASLFSQLLGLFDRGAFHKFVRDRGAERYSKGFGCWDQFVAMLFCQLAQAKSLREICGGLACCLGKIRHLGFNTAPRRSTLSYANAHRPWKLYRDMFYHVLAKCQLIAPGKKFRFRHRLLSLDATIIDLCLSLFPWAKFRTTKGAVKLHLLLDHDGSLPVFADITAGKVHEVKVARTWVAPLKVKRKRGGVCHRETIKNLRETAFFNISANAIQILLRFYRPYARATGYARF